MHWQRARKYGSPEGGPKSYAPIEQRFWRNVKRAGPDECWVYGSGRGYGRIGTGGQHAPLVGAHCFSYELHHGPIPEGQVVLHSCDNPACVNPAHLEAGTQQKNVRDMVARGRQPDYERTTPDVRGERNGHSRLSEADVRDIRSRRAEGRAALARAYGLSEWAIRDVLSGKNWKHIT